MADERRRELRRRRILENSEARKDRIFGINKPVERQEVEGVQSTVPSSKKAATPAFATSTPLPATTISESTVPGGSISVADTPVDDVPEQVNPLESSSTSSEQCSHPPSNLSTPLSSHQENTTKQTQRIKPSELFTHANVPDNQNGIDLTTFATNLMNDPRLLNVDGSNNSSYGAGIGDTTEVAVTLVCNHPVIPFLLALLVCFFISTGLGHVMYGSLIIPFVLWEGQRLLWNHWQRSNTANSNTGLLGTALLLCGIPQKATAYYMLIFSAMKSVMNDFALYLVTIVVWFVVVGLPDDSMNGRSSDEILPEPNLELGG